MNESPISNPEFDRERRSGRQALRGVAQNVRPMLLPETSNSRGPMSDRLSIAVMELIAALRDEIATERQPREREPDRLLSVVQAARALGIGRTALYSEIGAGRIRSLKVGRRRLIPSSAIIEVASRQG